MQGQLRVAELPDLMAWNKRPKNRDEHAGFRACRNNSSGHRLVPTLLMVWIWNFVGSMAVILDSTAAKYPKHQPLPVGSLVVPFWDYLLGF